MRGKPPKSRSPQEKKSLSYAKDRRNAYRENDKASRKTIPKRKAEEHRLVRRTTKQALEGVAARDEEVAAAVESSAIHDVASVGGWRKVPDQTLAEHIRKKEHGRAFREGRQATARVQKQTHAFNELKGVGWIGDLDQMREGRVVVNGDADS